MLFTFYKYHGAGNDFIVLNNLDNSFSKILNTKIIQKLCERHFGIGADGLIVLENDTEYDFYMKYYNADGKESTMCGNGGRCIVSFAYGLGIVKEKVKFNAIDFIHNAIIHSAEYISLQMIDVEQIMQFDDDLVLNTGSPHYIKFVKNINDLDVFKYGREIRNKKEFSPDGINVNFVEPAENFIKIRTYERGVEAETNACGTGSVAAVIAYLKNKEDGDYNLNVLTKKEELNVKFTKSKNQFKNIFLSGAVKFVYKGQYNLS